MITDDLQTVLLTAASNVYHIIAAPKPPLPYVVFDFDDDAPTTYVDGTEGLTNYQTQVEIFAATPTEARTIAADARTAMLAASAFKSVCTGSRDIFDFETNRPGVRVLFSIWQ